VLARSRTSLGFDTATASSDNDADLGFPITRRAHVRRPRRVEVNVKGGVDVRVQVNVKVNGSYSSFAVIVIGVADSARDTGQPFFAVSASSPNLPASTPGTLPVTSR